MLRALSVGIDEKKYENELLPLPWRKLSSSLSRRAGDSARRFVTVKKRIDLGTAFDDTPDWALQYFP